MSRSLRPLLAAFTALAAACDAGTGAPATPPTPSPSPSSAPHATPSPGARPPVAFVRASVEPALALYRPGLRLRTAAEVVDVLEAARADVEVRWRVDPEGAAMPLSDGRWEILAEGAIALRACATEPGLDGAEVCDEVPLLSDAAPPRIEIQSPEPGAWLRADEAESLLVVGRVLDTHGELHAWVNGEPVPLDAQGVFAAAVTPRFGINHLEVAASDGLHAREVVSALDLMWAPAYVAPDADGAFALEDSVRVRLGRRSLDDDLPLDIAAAPWVGTDLADILEMLVRETDVLGRVLDPLVDSAALTLRLSEIDVGAPHIDIVFTDGGVELFLRLDAVRLVTEGRAAVQGGEVSLAGELTAALAAQGRVRVAKLGAGAPLEAEVEVLEMVIDSARSSFDAPEADALFELAQSAVRGAVEEALLEEIAAPFASVLPGLLRESFEIMEWQLRGQRMVVDSLLGPTLEVGLDGTFASLRAYAGRHADAHLAMRVRNRTPPTAPPPGPGVPLATSPGAEPPYWADRRVQAAVSLALPNAVLHHLWASGLLEADVTHLLPEEVSFFVQGASVSAKLPVIVGGPVAEHAPHPATASAGQIELTLDFERQQDVYGVSISTGVDLVVDGAWVLLRPDPAPRLRVWPIRTTGEAPTFDSATLQDVLLDLVWPQVLALIRDQIYVPLPVPDVSGAAELADSLSALRIALVESTPLAVREGWLMADGEMRATLPR